MGKRVTNINNGGTVGVQHGQDNDDDRDRGTVTNVNNGGVVGIQASTVSGNTVVIQQQR